MSVIFLLHPSVSYVVTFVGMTHMLVLLPFSYKILSYSFFCQEYLLGNIDECFLILKKIKYALS